VLSLLAYHFARFVFGQNLPRIFHVAGSMISPEQKLAPPGCNVPVTVP
jgi:hypothetical protein